MSDDEIRSKTRVKRDLKALQAFVRELIDTADTHLDQLPLSRDLLEEIRIARGMKMGARKRQVGFISKQMAGEPVDEARIRLQQLQQPASRANALFHRLEDWRSALLAGDEILFEQLVANMAADRQQLRNLVRSARKETGDDKPPRASRQLFRYLRDLAEDIDEEADALSAPPSDADR